MTNEEAVKYGTEWLKDECLDARDGAFIKMALEALRQEPCEDCISREAVLDLCDSKDPEYKVRYFKEDVECLPPVTLDAESEAQGVPDTNVGNVMYDGLILEKQPNGRHYYSVKYKENGEGYIGYSSYDLQIVGNYIKKYFIDGQYARGYNDAKREIASSGEYERAYERGKADAQTERWIPVSEGLPSENGCYLVSTTGTNNDIIDIAYYTKEIWHKASRIKAWMPLPEPYRAESEDNENVHQV